MYKQIFNGQLHNQIKMLLFFVFLKNSMTIFSGRYRETRDRQLLHTVDLKRRIPGQG